MANNSHITFLKNGSRFWNRWRKENPEINPDLRDSDLSGMNLHKYNLKNVNFAGSELSHIYFHKANLSGADLSCSSLSKSDFSESDLSDAYLPASNLEHTIFSRSNLYRCDFSFANLQSSTLEESNIEYVNFSKAHFEDTRLLGIDLSGAINLDKSKIYSSSLDTSTLLRSSCERDILLAFGIPELLMDYLPSFSKNSISYHSVFISYSKSNYNIVNDLYESLSENGVNCWLDSKQLFPGDDITESIDRGVRIWDKFILCCSKESLSSWWVDMEINKVLIKEQQFMQKNGVKVNLLIPVDLDGYLYSDNYNSGIKSELIRRLAGDFTSLSFKNRKDHPEFSRLITALRVDAGGRPIAPISKL